jgi:hypothetical protein
VKSSKRAPTAAVSAPHPIPDDSDLAHLIDVWAQLSKAMRDGIMAIVKAAVG